MLQHLTSEIEMNEAQLFLLYDQDFPEANGSPAG